MWRLLRAKAKQHGGILKRVYNGEHNSEQMIEDYTLLCTQSLAFPLY